jgi:hypothetical protein
MVLHRPVETARAYRKVQPAARFGKPWLPITRFQGTMLALLNFARRYNHLRFKFREIPCEAF